MKNPLDQFSAQSNFYKKYRPTYPAEFYDFILHHVSNFDTCWDCATGNGQVAGVLAEHFEKVYASDMSEKQLSHAIQKPNIHYAVQRAEQTNYQDHYFDLITVGQALHWFDFDAFNTEVRRVIKPQGILAVWGYGLFRVDEDIDALIDHFYQHIVGPYWAFERSHVDSKYSAVPLAIHEKRVHQDFSIQLEWSLEHVTGYLNSWSAVQNYKNANNNENPVPMLIDELRPHWGSSAIVRMPLFYRIGTVA